MGLVPKGQGGPTTYVKMKFKNGPRIVKVEKVDGEYQETEFAAVEGNLDYAEIKKEDSEKYGTSYKLVVRLTEPMEDTIQLESSIGWATYGFINSILNCEVGQKVKVQPGLRKVKETGDMYNTVWFSDAKGDLIPWAYELKDLPKVEKAVIRGNKITDDTALVEFFTEALKAKFGGSVESVKKVEPVSEPAEDFDQAADLPF